eukprot:jgi/Botrbrau1/6696/Bobra.0202s0033.2
MFIDSSTFRRTCTQELLTLNSRNCSATAEQNGEPPCCSSVNSQPDYIPKGQAKVRSLVNTGIRFLFFPVFLFQFVRKLPSRVVFQEPNQYMAPKTKPRRSVSAYDVTSADSGGSPSSPGTGWRSWFTDVLIMEQHMEEEIKIVLGKFWLSAYMSYMATWQCIVYYVSLYTMWLLGLEHVFFHWQEDIEWLIAKWAGTMHITKDGEKVPFSFVSSMDPEYGLPYDVVGGFPFGATVESPENAHFMSLCSKLVYEDGRIVKDMVQHRWGLMLHDYFKAPAHQTSTYWVPDFVWFTCSNAEALILCFKGADPSWQLNVKADPPMWHSYDTDLECRIHGGLLVGLSESNPHKPTQSMFGAIIDSLKTHGAGKKIFICGHSIGGGISAYVSLFLHQMRKEDLGRHIAGIFTFGSPRCGDKQFASLFSEAFAGRAFRYVYASDVIVKLPPLKEYAQPPLMRLITSYPQKTARGKTQILREEKDQDLIGYWEAREDRLGYYFSTRKLWDNLMGTSGENWVRLYFRALLLPMPGVSDHFPSEYERALRKEVNQTFHHAAASPRGRGFYSHEE